MNFKFSRIAVFLVVALTALWSASCTEDVFVTPKVFGKITGKVIDNVTKKPLSDVLIKLNPSGRSLLTDTTGNFLFDSLTVGSYTISAEKTSLFNEYVTVEVADSQNPVVTIYMSEDIKSNRAPTQPTRPIPATGTTLSGVNGQLFAWTATDPDRDTLTFDVYLFKEGSSPATPFRTNYGNDTLFVDNLEYDKTYYWQVVAKDKREKVFSEIWTFKTPKFPSLSYVFARETGGIYQIYAANDDKTVVQLTTEGSNWRPIVSPDGEKIAFISNRSTNLHIFTINRDGSGLRQVTDVPVGGLLALDLSFCWANNGSKIIYPSNNRLYSINIDGTGRTEVARAPSGRQFAGCDWNEATKAIVARTTGETVYDNQLSIIYNGGFSTTIFTTDKRMSNPAVSIDGGEILFSLDTNPLRSENGRQIDARIYELYLDQLPEVSLRDLSSATGTNSNNAVKPAGTNDLDPRYSPNGQSIIFTNVNNVVGSVPSLYTTPLGGSRNRVKIVSTAEMGYWRQQ
ncbi:carboxypeptidase-like regulatory domain-containing protein [Persicitalea sp.]|uniref:carboxypeptidase-like regulatory domain-containing protein n=1 Tax=Persicitalea sp. TaxID=3100273 RepID=UPI00359486AB